MRFDASIDLTRPDLPEDAEERVRQAVSRMSGACWISVERHPGAPSARWVTLYVAGKAEPVEHPSWEGLRSAVERIALEAIESGRKPVA